MEPEPATQLNPTILPQSANPPVYGPVASPQKSDAPPKFQLPQVKPWMIIAGVIAILIVGSIVFAIRQQPKNTIAPTPVASITPTPTPLQILNPFATASAFLDFENHVSALPDIITRAVLQDQTITPPVLDLNLGF